MALPSFWSEFLAAIRAQESGGNYTQDSAGCLGAYCWNAQSNWDTDAAAAGQSKYVGINPSQVPPSVQDDVASSNLAKIYQQTGSLLAAAMWWNGGSTTSEANPGLPAQPWAPSCGGGTSAAYACQVLRRMALGGHYVAGAGSGSGGTVTTAAASESDCAFPPGGFQISLPVVGNVGGSLCLVTKSEVRGVYAVLLLTAGTILMGVGLGFTAAFALPKAATRIFVAPIMSAVPRGSGGGQSSSGSAQARRAYASGLTEGRAQAGP